MDALVDSFVSNYAFSTVFSGGGESDDERQVAGAPVDVLLGSGNQTGGGDTPQFAGLAVPAGLVLDTRFGTEYKKYNSNHAHYDGGNGNYSVIDDDLFDTLYNSVAKERNKKSNGTQKISVQPKIRPSRKHRKST